MSKIGDDLRDRVMSATAEEVTRLRCPVCGKGLLIFFSGGQRRALNIHCSDLTCLSVHLDGTFAEPLWVSKLGNKVETSDDAG
jgi:hypothetical protein